MQFISDVVRLITILAIVAGVSAVPNPMEKADVKRDILVPRTGHCKTLFITSLTT